MTCSGRFATRLAWLITGFGALAAAGLGVLLPLLPTTPFVLVAAFAFARSSRRLQQWLLGHSIFGPLIADWRRYGAISRPAKAAGILSTVGVFALSLLLRAPMIVLIVQVFVLGACVAFIASRPAPPRR